CSMAMQRPVSTHCWAWFSKQDIKPTEKALHPGRLFLCRFFLVPSTPGEAAGRGQRPQMVLVYTVAFS
ncbi:hypothetical protein RA25_04690, partial [Leisingera sp. ANG-S5]